MPRKSKKEHAEYMRGYVAQNRDKINARRRELAAAVREQVNETRRKKYDPEKNRNGLLKRNYGITTVDFDRMLKEQGGRCAICSGKPNGLHPRFHVDHDHKTGAVRGLLCSTCNNGLGCFKDSAALLDSAKLYLGKHAA